MLDVVAGPRWRKEWKPAERLGDSTLRAACGDPSCYQKMGSVGTQRQTIAGSVGRVATETPVAETAVIGAVNVTAVVAVRG